MILADMRNLKYKYLIYCVIFNVCAMYVAADTKLILPTAITPTAPMATTAATPQETANTAAAIPAGIFNTIPHLFRNVYAYDNSDVYIPLSSASHDHFSWQLLRNVLAEKTNVIISPFSVEIILAMLTEAAGHDTQTQRQLITTLGDMELAENLSGFYKNLLTTLKQETPYTTLNMEAKMFADSHIKPRQSYAAKLSNFYDTHIERLNFTDAQAAADHINSWCTSVTEGKLQNLVTKENTQNVVLLLANVIYFKGLWRHQFSQTFDGVFFTTPETQCRVQYMQLTEYFYYYEDHAMAAKILRLPYKDNKFSMFILLRNTAGDVEKLLPLLQTNQVKNMQYMMEETKLKVTMPKFKFDFDKSLKSTLFDLGIQDMFTDAAALPALDRRGSDLAQNLKVSDIIQKAGIEVNEQGTEAYAATAFEIVNKFGGEPIIEEFTINRPFIFFIEEEATGSIVFAGKVLKPVL